MYNERFKPELKKDIAPEKIEQLILSHLSFDQQSIFQDTKKIVEKYKTQVTDEEKKDFHSQGTTRKKILEFGNRLTRDQGIISNQDVLFRLLQNILQGVAFPQNTDSLIFNDYTAELIKEVFAVPDSGSQSETSEENMKKTLQGFESTPKAFDLTKEQGRTVLGIEALLRKYNSMERYNASIRLKKQLGDAVEGYVLFDVLIGSGADTENKLGFDMSDPADPKGPGLIEKFIRSL